MRAKSSELLAILARVFADVRQITARATVDEISLRTRDARGGTRRESRCRVFNGGSSIFVAARRKEALSSPLQGALPSAPPRRVGFRGERQKERERARRIPAIPYLSRSLYANPFHSWNRTGLFLMSDAITARTIVRERYIRTFAAAGPPLLGENAATRDVAHRRGNTAGQKHTSFFSLSFFPSLPFQIRCILLPRPPPTAHNLVALRRPFSAVAFLRAYILPRS